LQTLKPPYHPLFNEYEKNLKRKELWSSVEVHVIYTLVYTLCMSQSGVNQLRKYMGAEDPDVFDPLFIAQYLLVPVNTIVKNCLLPWMMEQLKFPAHLTNKDCARKIKAEVFLKFSLLVQLMQIVKKFGRNDKYNFENDEKLAKIKSGMHSVIENSVPPKSTLAISSFMTIWLLTLPEKFQEWFKNRNSLSNLAPGDDKLFFTGTPSFPIFAAPNSQTSLIGHPDKIKYEFLPKTWSLLECFEYYYNQKGMWSTMSVEKEWDSVNKMFATDSSDNEEENENEEGGSKDERNKEGQTKSKDDSKQASAAIKTDTDEEEDTKLQASTTKK